MVKLVVNGLKTGKARFACAVAGVAIAVGALVFMTSLVATNNAQAPAAAKRACAPWAAWRLDGIEVGFRRRMPPPPGGGRPGMGERPGRPGMGERPGRPGMGGMRPPPEMGAGRPVVAPCRENQTISNHQIKQSPPDLELSVVQTTVDYRPGGHVLQGPPMMAFIAKAPAKNPYGAVRMVEGRWVDESSGDLEVVCVKKSMRRFGASAPALGEPLKFVGKSGTMTAKIVGYMDGDKLPAEFPYVFANALAFSHLEGEKHGTVSFYSTVPPGKVLTPDSESVIRSFKADEQKRMDFATPLLLVAAFLTALSLLVNSLLLSVESQRKNFAMLRIIGLTRSGVVGLVTLEALITAFVGWAVGILLATGSIAGWVAFDPAAFPAGMAMDVAKIRMTLFILPVIVILAVLLALRPALKVRPMDVLARRTVSRRFGMAVTFACGFAAFVAVEVWGASLMRAFVPSPEWPDAIVSILPGGVSSYDVEKLRKLEGVRRISELVPRQCFMTGKPRSNALFLAAEWLPRFNFIEGDWETADKALKGGNAVVITEMMSNAHGLHKGDKLSVQVAGRRGPPEEIEFPIAGVVDLNWHMVTSRGLVRGLNGAPGMTDGAVFCSLDTIGIIDPRTYIVEPAMSAPMTHLWVEYDPEFLARHGVFPAGRLIEASIAKALGNPEGSTVRLHARDEIADGTLAHGSDIIGQAARVPFVFLAILAIGFVAMLVAESDARRREFATLRAVGATKSQLAGMLTKSAVKTALVGILVGLPVGSLAGWLFTFKTGNWPGLPHWFVLPVEVVAEGALGAVLFALAFAVPTSIALVGRGRGESGGTGSVGAWLRFFRVVNVPTVPGDVLVGASAIAWGAIGCKTSAIGFGVVPIVAACIASIGLYLFGLADNDIVGAKSDGAERPIPYGAISLGAARIARGMCLFAAMIAGAIADLPCYWWIAAFLLAVAIVAYNRTKWCLAMGLCRGLNVLCGGAAVMSGAWRGVPGAGRAALVCAAVAFTLYIAGVTRFSEGEEANPARRRAVGLLIGALVYLQLLALLAFYLLSPSLATRNLLLVGAGMLILLRLAKRAFPKVSAS